MNADEIRARLAGSFEDCEVTVEEPAPGKFLVTLVGERFEGLPRVKRELQAGAPLRDAILEGRLHAVSYNVHTPAEWSGRGR